VSTTGAAVVTMIVLAAAGVLPTLALVGARWMAVTLAPLAGAVVAGLAASGELAFGGPLLGWFIGLAVTAALAVAAVWAVRPEWRPGSGADGRAPFPVAAAVGAVGILAACAWSLRSLATPTVGFDARALWIMRAGWFLEPHHQLLVNLRLPSLLLDQTSYPPLVSASSAVAWSLTGVHTDRLGVVVVALLNACAVATAAYALVECGRRAAARRATAGGGAPAGGVPTLVPLATGVVAAVLLVFIAFGIAEPFITNGYADPLWSLAAVGAVAFGLQLPGERGYAGAAVILVLVAGMSKNEGFVTAVALIALIAFRQLLAAFRSDRRHRWWHPLAVAVAELAAIAVWPVLMRVLHTRNTSSTLSSVSAWPGRARATYDGFLPYLHVLYLAVPVALVGGVVLRRVRRTSGLGNDGWAWAGLAAGLLAVGAALVTGSVGIQSWLLTTVHRVTEFPAMAGWWIVAAWAVVAAAALAGPGRTTTPEAGADIDGEPETAAEPGPGVWPVLERQP
jgi:hypothetical protein